MNLIPRYVLYETYPVPCLYRQTYSGIFTFYSDICSHIVAYLEPFVNLTYPEPRHIQNPGIFGTRYIQGSVKAFSGIFRTLCNVGKLRTLPCPELCHIQNVGLFTTRGIFRILFILAHSGIFRHIK